MSGLVTSVGACAPEEDYLPVDLEDIHLIRAATQVAEQVIFTSPSYETQHFLLYSSPRSNLYHFLIQWAWLDLGETPTSPEDMPEREEDFDQLSAEDRDAWQSAVDTLSAKISGRALLSDDISAINGYMIEPDPEVRQQMYQELSASGQELISAVEGVLELYTTTWWPEHHAVNLRWINTLLPILSRAEVHLTNQLASIYGASELSPPIVINVSYYLTAMDTHAQSNQVSLTSRGHKYPRSQSLERLFKQTWEGFEPLEAKGEITQEQALRNFLEQLSLDMPSVNNHSL